MPSAFFLGASLIEVEVGTKADVVWERCELRNMPRISSHKYKAHPFKFN
jgi:hypothetical protein